MVLHHYMHAGNAQAAVHGASHMLQVVLLLWTALLHVSLLIVLAWAQAGQLGCPASTTVPLLTLAATASRATWCVTGSEDSISEMSVE